jgi:dihydroneopterin aldolase
MDIVYIRDLKIDTVIGIFDWERRIRQIVSIDLEMAADIRKAAASDNIADALDYKAVTKRLIAFVSGSEFQLVETLSEKVADIVMTEFNVPWLRLRLSKPGAVRGAQDVGVIIERATKADDACVSGSWQQHQSREEHSRSVACAGRALWRHHGVAGVRKCRCRF